MRLCISSLVHPRENVVDFVEFTFEWERRIETTIVGP